MEFGVHLPLADGLWWSSRHARCQRHGEDTLLLGSTFVVSKCK